MTLVPKDPRPALRPGAALSAVVFDLDGTLVDTEALCNETGLDTCQAMGLDVTAAFFEGLAGVADAERLRRLSALTGRDIDPEAFLAEWDRRCEERFAQGIPVKPGAFALLSALREGGLRLGLATSSRREQGHLKLRLSGLLPWFDTVVVVEDVERPKPAPDPYLLACRRLGVAPAQAAAFEDSETGARAARAAGMVVVQVPDLHPTRGEHADHVVASLWEGGLALGLVEGQPA